MQLPTRNQCNIAQTYHFGRYRGKEAKGVLNSFNRPCPTANRHLVVLRIEVNRYRDLKINSNRHLASNRLFNKSTTDAPKFLNVWESRAGSECDKLEEGCHRTP